MAEMLLTEEELKSFLNFMEHAYAAGRQVQARAREIESSDPTVILVKGNILNAAKYLETIAGEFLKAALNARFDSIRLSAVRH